MKRIIIMILVWVLSSQLHADMLSALKSKVRTIGKKTPIDVALYAKNPSQGCSLRISNIINPYKRDLTPSKLEPIELEVGRYYRSDVPLLLKGAYEFEYAWMKGKKFVDSNLKTIHIFAYHDTRNRIHKKVNLTFLLRVPKICR